MGLDQDEFNLNDDNSDFYQENSYKKANTDILDEVKKRLKQDSQAFDDTNCMNQVRKNDNKLIKVESNDVSVKESINNAPILSDRFSLSIAEKTPIQL